MPNRAELIQAGFDPAAYVAVDRDWYDGSIRAMDAEIARLFEHLGNLGLDRNTLVIFLGDHGEEFLEHGRMFHGQSVYGELTQVPLILWGPNWVPRGSRIGDTVETIDVMPTLLQLAGLRGPRAMQGRSLLPLLAAAHPPRSGSTAEAAETSPANGWQTRPAITEKAALAGPGGGPPPYDTESYSIEADGWKLIHNVKPAAGQPEYELYEKRGDPLDRKDVASAHPDLVARLARQLEQWHAKAVAQRLPPDTESTEGLSAQELERLRSLGYVQ